MRAGATLQRGAARKSPTHTNACAKYPRETVCNRLVIGRSRVSLFPFGKHSTHASCTYKSDAAVAIATSPSASNNRACPPMFVSSPRGVPSRERIFAATRTQGRVCMYNIRVCTLRWEKVQTSLANYPARPTVIYRDYIYPLVSRAHLITLSLYMCVCTRTNRVRKPGFIRSALAKIEGGLSSLHTLRQAPCIYSRRGKKASARVYILTGNSL